MVDRPLFGPVYGSVPEPPGDCPDVASMLETAGIPVTEKDQQLPFSLEWYAGAKDRQIARDQETQGHIGRRNELRSHWSDLVRAELESWGSRVEKMITQPEPTDLVTLLARTVTERPDDTNEINSLRASLSKAEGKRAIVREELISIREHQTALDDAVREKEEQDARDEKARQDKEAADKKRKAAAEAALRKAAKALYGEENPDEEQSESEAVDTQAEADSPREPLGEASGATLAAGTSGEGGPLPPLQSPPVASLSPPASVRGMGTATATNTPTPSRSGYSRELPPLASPPPPPPL